MNDTASFQLGVTCGACAVYRVVEAKQAEINALKTERDELLAALDGASEDFWGLGFAKEGRKVDKAIAKARGDQV